MRGGDPRGRPLYVCVTHDLDSNPLPTPPTSPYPTYEYLTDEHSADCAAHPAHVVAYPAAIPVEPEEMLRVGYVASKAASLDGSALLAAVHRHAAFALWATVTAAEFHALHALHAAASHSW